MAEFAARQIGFREFFLVELKSAISSQVNASEDAVLREQEGRRAVDDELARHRLRDFAKFEDGVADRTEDDESAGLFSLAFKSSVFLSN